MPRLGSSREFAPVVTPRRDIGIPMHTYALKLAFFGAPPWRANFRHVCQHSGSRADGDLGGALSTKRAQISVRPGNAPVDHWSEFTPSVEKDLPDLINIDYFLGKPLHLNQDTPIGTLLLGHLYNTSRGPLEIVAVFNRI